MEQAPHRNPIPGRPQGQRPTGNNELILVVDDEEAIRIVSRRTLESYGYRVILASDGMEAVRLFGSRAKEIAAVITDLSMPGMDGIEAIQSMTAFRPDIRVIAMSGYSVTERPGGAELPSQVRATIDKPYTPETLLSKLRQVLDAP